MNKLPGILRFQINFVIKIPAHFNKFLPSENPSHLLELNDKFDNFLERLKKAQGLHLLVRLIQYGFLLHELKNRKNQIDGDTVIVVNFCADGANIYFDNCFVTQKMQ